LGFDYAFVGEADLGLVEFADGKDPQTIPGIVTTETSQCARGTEIKPLDLLPFPDWSLCDYQFYSFPSYGKIKFRCSRSLDVIMGRGCVYQCAFCAYNALSAVRFYSHEYLVEQIEYMAGEFDIDAVYFTDSTIGNNRKLLQKFCELMIQRGTAQRVEWYANMRPNQVNEQLLKLMWRAGCRFLFYGFESGSQRVLDLMVKGIEVEANYRAAELHNKLNFPYHASILLGYPGEREADIQKTFEFLRRTAPPIIGVNWYVPLPGSPDYDKLKSDEVIMTEDPWEWRRIGEVNSARVYADIPEARFRELFAEAERLAYVDVPKQTYPAWGCIAPPEGALGQEDTGLRDRIQSSCRSTVLKLLRSVRI
jgi:anaerobic magnesium-protoporphyrin IX monomethyl ester cyclase